MTYAITHTNTTTNEVHTVYWSVPYSWGWSKEQVRDSFEVRFNNANVIEIKACS